MHIFCTHLTDKCVHLHLALMIKEKHAKKPQPVDQLLSPDGTALVIPMVDDIHILFSGQQ
jgi:hypothetical protein